MRPRLIYNTAIVCWLDFSHADSTDWSSYVDLFIGTQGPVSGQAWNGGNVFPGAALPFGAVKVGPDTTE